MALYDWNHNGKKDIQDDFIEYNIYKNTMGEHQSSGGSGFGFGTVICVIIILYIIGAIMQAATPKCSLPGCNGEAEKGSSYCYFHQSEAARDYHMKHYRR